MNDNYVSGIHNAVEQIRTRMLPGGLFDTAENLRFIESNTGDPYACKGFLRMHAIAQAMLCWFDGSDLHGLKQWFHVAGQIQKTLYQERPGKDCRTPVYLAPLLSDNADLIKWYAEFQYPYTRGSGTLSAKQRDNPKADEFYHYNTLLVIRGDWSALASRCRTFLSDVPPRQKSYQADHRFHLALCEGDVAGMEAALAEIVEPKLMKRRQEEEAGTTAPFICTFAVIYAKIAWLHGYEVQVSSPFVPKEWLPVAQLDRYDDVYSFVAESDDTIPVLG